MAGDQDPPPPPAARPRRVGVALCPEEGAAINDQLLSWAVDNVLRAPSGPSALVCLHAASHATIPMEVSWSGRWHASPLDALVSEGARKELRHLPMELELLLGSPKDELVKASAGLDVLVMGATSQPFLRPGPWHLPRQHGQTTQYCAQNASCPVVCVRPGPPIPRPLGAHRELGRLERARTVAVCYDGSPTAQHAGSWAIRELLQPGDLLYLLVSKGSPEENLDVSQIQPVPKGVTVRRGLVGLSGPPKESIVEFCKFFRVDVVVLGNRGLSQVARFFMGSTSSHVLAEAPCTVVVVKLPPPGSGELAPTVCWPANGPASPAAALAAHGSAAASVAATMATPAGGEGRGVADASAAAATAAPTAAAHGTEGAASIAGDAIAGDPEAFAKLLGLSPSG